MGICRYHSSTACAILASRTRTRGNPSSRPRAPSADLPASEPEPEPAAESKRGGATRMGEGGKGLRRGSRPLYSSSSSEWMGMRRRSACRRRAWWPPRAREPWAGGADVSVAVTWCGPMGRRHVGGTRWASPRLAATCLSSFVFFFQIWPFSRRLASP